MREHTAQISQPSFWKQWLRMVACGVVILCCLILAFKDRLSVYFPSQYLSFTIPDFITYSLIFIGIVYLIYTWTRIRLYRSIFLTILMGSFLSFIAFFSFLSHQESSLKMRFEMDAKKHVTSIEKELSKHIQTIQSLHAFYESSQYVDPQEFQTFATELVQTNPGVRALEWAPEVKSKQRKTYMESMRQAGHTGFEIRELNPQMEMIKANQRKVYYPITYIEPFSGNERAFGFDLGSNSSRLSAIEQSRDLNQMIATRRIQLVQDDLEAQSQYGFLILQPVYNKESRKESIAWRKSNLEGFVLGVFQAKSLIDQAIKPIYLETMNVEIVDHLQDGGIEYLYGIKSLDERNRAYSRAKERIIQQSLQEIKIEIAGRTWSIRFEPKPDYFSYSNAWHAFLILLLGFVVTLIGSGYLYQLTHSKVVFESLSSRLKVQINERRKAEDELKELNSTLEERVEERNSELKQRASQLEQTNQSLKQTKEALLNVLNDLEEERNERQLILDSAGEGIYGLDLEGKTTFVNPAAAAMLGWEPEELVGKYQHDVLHHTRADGNPYKKEDCPIHAVLKDGKVCHIDDEVFWKKDRTSFPVEYTSKPIYKNGKLVGAVVTFKDISKRKQMETQLAQSQKMESVGKLAGGIAHDFNNLMMVVSGYTQFLEKDIPKDHICREAVEEIQKASERATSLTKQLLAFSRRQIFKPEIVNINTVVEDMQKMSQRVIGEQCQIVTKLKKDLGVVKVDKNQIEQVLLNLVMNARDAMQNGGDITLSTYNFKADKKFMQTHAEMKPGSYVVLEVSDTGTGIDDETKARIFEPFFSTKGKGKGTGLGLATAYGIIKQSGAFIDVESQVNKGTSFRVYFPQQSGQVNEKNSNGTHNQVMPRGSETILVVEDEKPLRNFIARCLEDQGYQVLKAEDGVDAMKKVGEYDKEIHLLLTDMIMPNMDGHVLSQNFQKERPKSKIIFMSGYTENELARKNLSKEKSHFLQKPFAPVLLASKVREVLDLSEKVGKKKEFSKNN